MTDVRKLHVEIIKLVKLIGVWDGRFPNHKVEVGETFALRYSVILQMVICAG
jgi:hypothetical protein